jgi:hypothetical protein
VIVGGAFVVIWTGLPVSEIIPLHFITFSTRLPRPGKAEKRASSNIFPDLGT